MALSSEDKERLLSYLRTDQGFREEVRREVLTAELLSLPERFAALVDEVHTLTGSVDALAARVDALTARVDAFVEATDRRLGSLERQVTRLADDYGDLRGLILEQQVRHNPGYYLHKYARRVHVMSIDQLLDEPETPALSEEEQDVLARTDVLARGVSRGSGRAVFLVVDATWRPHSGDVEREVSRRDVLASKGVETLAIIVSKRAATESVRRLAEASGVVLESAEPQEPTEAASR